MRLTLGQKREVVDLAASKKFTHRELAEKFRVGRTTITNICRQEELIRNETDSADATKKKRKTTKCTYDLRVLDECLHKWRMEVKVSSPDTKLTGTVLQQKAMELATKIQHDPYADLPDKVRQALTKFSASNGWLDGYRTRFGSFSSKQAAGEQNVIKNVDIQTRLREIHHSLSHVDLEDIWTGSEFAMIYKPDGDVGPTTQDGRFTVALFVSAAGEKFDMQVIGTERTPRQLHGVDPHKMFNIHYGHSKTGWQVAHTTVTMLKELNVLAKSRKRTFRVILDSAVPHVKAAMILDSQGDQRTFFVYDHLHIYFLPPNFKPPRYHPCHLGIIQAFKARFRYEMLETLLANYRSAVQSGQNFQPIRLLHTHNVFHWFYVALHSLEKHQIQGCWIHSGLLPIQAIANLNVKDILAVNEHAVPVAANPTNAGTSTPHQQHNHGSAPNTTPSSATAPTTPPAVINMSKIFQDLQTLMNVIHQVAPDLLQWFGIHGPPNAQTFVEVEGNPSVTDPGIDEVQIIRSVLQKHGYLATQRMDDDAAGRHDEANDLADESCPHEGDVLASIDLVKKFLRLSKNSNIMKQSEVIVQLNRLKAALQSDAAHVV
ncbi:TPA: hypothetical protein N0F65_000553 [Lagenidium giganteum]|uniref:DDE-1 domain-containing protein n=1 Tax=Lagenidium giganteum TaxID=4803 RepID=A0AAV2Z0A4_9STRA|nr:TPA: hypothetical protein N0F65_000553 [Lagenidium giganteum]